MFKENGMFKYTEIDNIITLLGIQESNSLGSGMYAWVYKTAYNTAIKFTVDKAYITYLKAFEGLNNLYAPRIINNFGAIAKMSNGDELYAVEMPLYESLDNAPDEVLDLYELDMLEKALECTEGVALAAQKINLSERVPKNENHFLRWFEVMQELINNNPRIRIDLHDANVMLDNKLYTLVFTDPVVLMGYDSLYSYTDGKSVLFKDMFDLEHVKSQLRVASRFSPSIDANVYITRRTKLIDGGYRTSDKMAELILTGGAG